MLLTQEKRLNKGLGSLNLSNVNTSRMLWVPCHNRADYSSPHILSKSTIS